MSIRFASLATKGDYELIVHLLEDDARANLLRRITSLAQRYDCIFTVAGCDENCLTMLVESRNMILFNITSPGGGDLINGGIHWDGKEWSVHT